METSQVMSSGTRRKDLRSSCWSYSDLQNNRGITVGEMLSFMQEMDPQGQARIQIHAAGLVDPSGSNLSVLVRSSVLKQTGGKIPASFGGSIRHLRFDLPNPSKEGFEYGRFFLSSCPLQEE
jgi:hypothetical protein